MTDDPRGRIRGFHPCVTCAGEGTVWIERVVHYAEPLPGGGFVNVDSVEGERRPCPTCGGLKRISR